MHYLSVLFALMLGAIVASEELGADLKGKFHQAFGRCAEKEGATPDDMKEIVEVKFPLTARGAKCVVACVYEEIKMLKSDVTWDRSALVDLFKNEDAGLSEKVVKVGDMCYPQALGSGDRCDVGAAMLACVVANAASVGLSQETAMG